MATDERRLDELNALTDRVIGCAYRVSSALGAGFLEKVYENALAHEMRKEGLSLRQQQPIKVRYDGVVVGDYVADFVVDEKLLLELKAIDTLAAADKAQALNYLKATGYPLCLLLNFGVPRLQIKRVIHTQ